MTRYRALIVDDEADIRELLEITLGRMDLETAAAADVAAARRLLAEKRFDVCLTDMRLPDGDGIELVEHIQAHYPRLPVAVITAYGNMRAAVNSLKAGAFDFVSKPVDLEILRNLVNTALQLDNRRGDKADASATLLGESPQMQALRDTIAKLARSQAPVYIHGESGSGKERAARMIHALGPRREQPFVPVNCGAIPAELMESEFFGHVKGSFTGATRDKQGLFQAANRGTLFLDEVAELPLPMQVKLLRAIQERAVRPVGAAEETAIDVRILSATHYDLNELAARGTFRQDLYYRLNVIELRVPPLRERVEDIPLFCEHILNTLAERNRLAQAPGLTDAALDALMRYPFPGNVRELENILERALTLCESRIMDTADLRLPTHAAPPAPPFPAGVADAGIADLPRGASLEEHLDEIEARAIQEALEKTRYNKTAAAKLLGISFRALRYRLKKLGIE